MTKIDTETKKMLEKKIEKYDFQKHSYCMVIHMDDTFITTKHFLNKLEGFSSQEKYPGRGKACISYDKVTNEVLDWGENPTFNPKDSVHFESFMTEIYRIYQKCRKSKRDNKRKCEQNTSNQDSENHEQNENSQNSESNEDSEDEDSDYEGSENCENYENCEDVAKSDETDEADENDKTDEADENDETDEVDENDETDEHDETENDKPNKANDNDRFKGFAEFTCLNKKDKNLLDAVSKFISLKFDKSFDYHEIMQKSNDAFHYIFIVPSSWGKRIRKWILRPLFINSGIITEKDHRDRILFLTDLETVFYHLQNQEYTKITGESVFRKGEESILCRVSSQKDGTASIQFNLIAPEYPQLNLSEAILVPRVLRSETFTLSPDQFKDKVRKFIKIKMIEECEDEILERIVDLVLSYFSQRKYFYSREITDFSNYYLFAKTNMTDWQLSEAQIEILRSIDVSNIFAEIDRDETKSKSKSKPEKKDEDENKDKSESEPERKDEDENKDKSESEPEKKDKDNNNTLQNKIVKLVDSNPKRRTLVLAHLYYSFNEQVPHLVPWLENLLESYKEANKYSIVTVTNGYKPSEHISLPNMMAGAATRASQVLRNANMIAVPFELTKDSDRVSRESPSSIFLNKKQNATVVIDISLKETSISYSSINEEGVITEVKNIKDERELPSLKTFFDISNGANLKVNNAIISFIDKYLSYDLDYFCKYDRQIKRINKESDENGQPSKPKEKDRLGYFFKRKDKKKDDLGPKIKNLFQLDPSKEEELVSTRQQKYIRTFLMIYLSYLNEVILKEKPEAKDSNIGYVIAIEKMLLDNLVGTKENFKEIVFASGVVQENDPTKKLKVITRGEELSILLQKASKIELSCKSYFVLFQLQEDYIQFTLNQVVTSSTLDNKESSIVIEDKIVPIRNIYKSLFENIWKQLTRQGDFVDSCDQHCDEQDENYDFLEFISYDIKKKLFDDFKKYFEDKIIQEEFDPQSTDHEKISLEYCNDCECSVNFTPEDIMNLAIIPTFKEIATTIFTVIANKDKFENYVNICGVFGLIYFNHNEIFQKRLADVLQDEIDQQMEGKEIEVKRFIVPELPCRFWQQKENEKSLLYQDFQQGSLSQVSSETYGFFATNFKGVREEINLSYIDKKTKKKVSKIYKNHVFPLLKKGEVIDSSGLHKTFYLDSQRETKQTFTIALYKLKTLDNVKEGERAPITTNFWDELKSFTLTNYEKGSNIPITISITPNMYSPILDFSVKFVGQDIASDKECWVKVSESMTIARF